MSIISTTAPRLRLPDQVDIAFGPAELLGPAFLQLDRAARERGIYLSISHDFAELAEVNRRNRRDWYPLVPMFDHTVGGVNADNGFWISGVNEQGDVVLTQAARLYLWPDSSFADEWTNLTFVYEDPHSQSQMGERCTENCAAAHELTGRVCHTGALWMRSDYRSQGLASILPRLTRAYALTRWMPDYWFGIAKMGPQITAQTVRRLYGWQNFDSAIQWYKSPHLGDIGDIAMVWMDEREVVSDLERFTKISAPPRTAVEQAEPAQIAA